MNDLTDNIPNDNLSGVRSFRFIPVVDVAFIPDAISSLITGPLILKTAKRWYNGYVIQKTSNYFADSGDGPNGPFYKFSFEGYNPRISQAGSENLTEMIRYRFLLDLIDNNGNRRLVGNLKNGLSFHNKETPGVQGTGLNSYFIGFTGEQTNIYNYTE